MVLTRPTPDDQGNLTVTWRCTQGVNTCVGWAVPDLDPNTDCAYRSHGSFISVSGILFGLGTQAIQELPSCGILEGGTLSLRYNPARGTLYTRANEGVEVLCFTNLRNDLVPAVVLAYPKSSCVIVVCCISHEKRPLHELEYVSPHILWIQLLSWVN